MKLLDRFRNRKLIEILFYLIALNALVVLILPIRFLVKNGFESLKSVFALLLLVILLALIGFSVRNGLELREGI